MLNFLRKLCYRAYRWIFDKTHETQITVKGIYLYNYLKKILKGEFKEEDYVQEYEDFIKEFQEANKFTREQAVYFYFLYLNEMLKKSREKYGEDPMSF